MLDAVPGAWYFRRMKLTRRALLGSAVVLGSGLSAGGASGDVVSPKDFGARGDGITNDTDAFAACAAYINARGGGTVVIPPGTYIVGRQVKAGALGKGAAYRPAPILQFRNCSRPVTISGKGATLRFAKGLRMGAFHPVTGAARLTRLPFVDYDYRADPGIMIDASGCASLIVEHVELDGNLAEHVIGGKWSVDEGWQCYAHGIHTVSNDRVTIRAVHAHHFAVDAMMQVDHRLSPNAASRPVTLMDCTFEYNARQGLSWVGGNALSATGCKFNHTGRARNIGLDRVLSSPPGAGVDLEAEESIVRNGQFIDCEFVNNVGAGVLAASGPVQDVGFSGCRFVGTTAWSAWPDKPGFRFDDCTFLGAVVNPYGDGDASRATQFHQCRFDDDPAGSPTGQVYGGVNLDRPLVDMSNRENVLFDLCTFRATRGSALPWSTRAIYKDCTMQQGTGVTGYPRGRYIGRNSIIGKVDINGSTIGGTLQLNGRFQN